MGVVGQGDAPAVLPPGKRPGTHFIVGWLGTRGGVDGCGKSRSHRDSIPDLSSNKLVFVLEILSGIWYYAGCEYEDTYNRYVPTFQVDLSPHHP